MYIPWTLPILLCLSLVCGLEEKDKRPIYVIAHMVNAIDQIRGFLDNGGNAVETDIQFNENGTVKEIFHGDPCDCVRNCTRSANFSEYLDTVRMLTQNKEGPYYHRLIYQFFDLKLSSVDLDYLDTAGRDLADHVIDHLWGRNRRRQQVVRAVMYIANVDKNQTIASFIDQFKDRGEEDLLDNVGFDGGANSIEDIQEMWEELGVISNVVLGDGNINCVSSTYPDEKLKQEVLVRDSPGGFIDIVYHWTIDDVTRMRTSLDIGVDGFITNTPELLIDVLNEPKYKDTLRVATFEDNPFQKFKSQKFDGDMKQCENMDNDFINLI